MSARHAGRWSAGALAVLGSVACTASMTAAAAGVVGAAAARMAGMAATGSGHPGGTLGALLRIGPWLIVASALLVAGAFALAPTLTGLRAVLVAVLTGTTVPVGWTAM